jgi:hypothetical protein
MATGVDTAPSPPALEVIEFLLGGGHHLPYEKTDIGPTPAAAVAASRAINAGDIAVMVGYAVCETTGAASASFRLRDGNNANGEVIARVNLLAGESVRDVLTPRGIRIFTGHLFLEWLSGSIEGVVFWKPQLHGNYYE